MSARVTTLLCPALPHVLVVDNHKILPDSHIEVLREDFIITALHSSSRSISTACSLMLDGAIVGIGEVRDLSTARRLRAEKPELPLILLLASNDSTHIETASGIGANSVLRGEGSVCGIVSALRKALSESVHIAPGCRVEQILTRRQGEALRLVALAYLAKSAKDRIESAQPHTASTH